MHLQVLGYKTTGSSAREHPEMGGDATEIGHRFPGGEEATTIVMPIDRSRIDSIFDTLCSDLSVHRWNQAYRRIIKWRIHQDRA